MAEWVIQRSRAIEPPSGADYDAAYIVRLTDGSDRMRELVVEFVAPSAVASVGYAEEIARRFRRAGEPPRHVVVDLEKQVRVVGADLSESDDGTEHR